jgi:OOP family OmpA-OmpF porin
LRLNKLTPIVLSSFILSWSSLGHAQEQPNAADLVGKSYIGAHALKMFIDNDRWMTDDPFSEVDRGYGLGGEFGYRVTEETELRLSYTKLNLIKEYAGFKEPRGSSAAFDVLYFPTKENFYVVAGLDALDIVNTRVSGDLGAGYRYYISNKSAFYVEGKGHYQFEDSYKDYSAKIGFVYFFGDDTKKVVRTKPAAEKVAVAPVAAVPVVKPLDTDGDGVIDSKDNCNTTPPSNKVDAMGCTIFTEENDEMQLHVNFDNSKSVVNAEYLDEIKVAADFLKKYPHTSLMIKGHTSSQGRAQFNKDLSQQRADAVVEILVKEFGIDSSRLTAQGLGEEQLLNTENNAAAHAENRRIEAKVVVSNKVAVKR